MCLLIYSITIDLLFHGVFVFVYLGRALSFFFHRYLSRLHVTVVSFTEKTSSDKSIFH